MSLMEGIENINEMPYHLPSKNVWRDLISQGQWWWWFKGNYSGQLTIRVGHVLLPKWSLFYHPFSFWVTNSFHLRIMRGLLALVGHWFISHVLGVCFSLGEWTSIICFTNHPLFHALQL